MTPNCWTLPDFETPNESAEQRIQALHKFQTDATHAINQSAQSSTTPAPVYTAGTKVWLEATNLWIQSHLSKLNPKRYGPFVITEVISPVAYRLQLPPAWNIHNVFHASLLSPYHETAQHGPNFT
jgi:hypothetical protein